jgi:hypothetical protein
MMDFPIHLIIKELKSRGADLIPHGYNRTLLDHLLGTYNILKTWKLPIDLCLSGLYHSCYSTGVYPFALYNYSEREKVKNLIGEDAEKRVFLFCLIDRKSFIRQIRCNGIETQKEINYLLNFENNLVLQKATVKELLLIEMANAADQAIDEKGDSSIWLFDVSKIGRLVSLLSDECPPIFNNCCSILEKDKEIQARSLYFSGLESFWILRSKALDYFSNSHELNPWVGEPLLFISLCHLLNRNWNKSFSCAVEANEILCNWGTQWDKRYSWNDWIEFGNNIRFSSLKKSVFLINKD